MSKKRRRRRNGRPEYQPTLKDRERVAIAAGGGMSHEEIAIALQISRNTLEKHYEHELSVGAYQKRIEVLEAMHATALKGNVSAQKAYAAGAVPLAPPPLPKDPAKPKELGKKQQAQLDAKGAQEGTEWKDLLPAPTTAH